MIFNTYMGVKVFSYHTSHIVPHTNKRDLIAFSNNPVRLIYPKFNPVRLKKKNLAP